MSLHHEEGNAKQLGWSIFLNTAFTIIEFIAGFFSGSLALISDATHNLTDTISLFIAYAGQKVSEKGADERRTYGYGRASILAAVINGFLLLGLSLFILHEAYLRFFNPEPVQGGVVAVVAGFGVLINGTVAAVLYTRSKKDLNIFGAFANMAIDAIASIGAVIGGVLILVTGETVIDALISAMIAILLLYGAYSVLRGVFHVLLEGVPDGIDVDAVKAKILSHESVESIDDLHIWAISSQYAALSCHIVVNIESLEEGVRIVQQIKASLMKDFNIQHTTIEMELGECGDTDH